MLRTAHRIYLDTRLQCGPAPLVDGEAVEQSGAASTDALKQRLALKTLLVPGGLGSTHKVLLLGKQVGVPPLRGCSFRTRVT